MNKNVSSNSIGAIH